MIDYGDRARIATGVMRESLETALVRYETGEHLRSIAVLGSAAQEVREAFDVLQTETLDDWQIVVARMARVPECLSGIQAAYSEGIDRGLVAASRQVVGVIETEAGVVDAQLQTQLEEIETVISR